MILYVNICKQCFELTLQFSHLFCFIAAVCTLSFSRPLFITQCSPFIFLYNLFCLITCLFDIVPKHVDPQDLCWPTRLFEVIIFMRKLVLSSTIRHWGLFDGLHLLLLNPTSSGGGGPKWPPFLWKWPPIPSGWIFCPQTYQLYKPGNFATCLMTSSPKSAKIKIFRLFSKKLCRR